MARRNSVDHTAMREMNLRLILNTLRLHSPTSRAKIATLTGLNKTSVSNMISNLMQQNIVQELGAVGSSNEVGRPGINIQLNPETGYMIGVEMGVGFISIVVTNFAFEIVARIYETTDGLERKDEILAFLYKLIDKVYHPLYQRQVAILGLAIGIPGLVDLKTSNLIFAPNLKWDAVPIRDLLAERYHFPIVVANEANMAAWGESYFGVAQQSESLLYISSGVGLGGGIVLNGKLMTGANGLAGEFGHMTINPTGAQCTCGNVGCWETVATESALFRNVQKQVMDGESTRLLSETGDDLTKLTVAMVVRAAENDDRVAYKALHTTASWLGIGIANLINALNPDHIVLGGNISLAHKFILPVIKDEIEKRSFAWIREQTTFSIATHIADASMMGGIAMIHQQVIENLRV